VSIVIIFWVLFFERVTVARFSLFLEIWFQFGRQFFGPHKFYSGTVWVIQTRPGTAKKI
jgi:hypothetical protein